jgi:hypothetical protein
MAGEGKGKDFYKSTYTHEQLWDMLNEGDDWAVEQGASVWVSAASGMKAAREEMVVHVQSLRTQWTGSASDEFEYRMGVVEDYSIVSEEGMKSYGELKIPALAQLLKTAQTDAQGADLYPSSTETYDDWLESNNIDKTKPEYEAKKTQYERQYDEYVDGRHEAMAKIVADLGDRYAQQKKEFETEVPPPPPSDMPGNSTYEKPTGGVFADAALSNSDDVRDAPTDSTGLDTAGEDGVVGTDDDLEPVDGGWDPGSYEDTDGQLAGGLAGGSGVPTGGGGYAPTMGGGGGGGGTIAGGAGLFGPARGATPVGGAGNTPGRGPGGTPGRGTGSSSPARAGASSGTGRSGSGSGGRGGMNSGNGNRPGGSRSGSGGRGGTRSGYYDDDDEDTYTRETWLREDDVDWSRNRVREEELDED